MSTVCSILFTMGEHHTESLLIFLRAVAAAGMGICVLPGANYVGFHSNQTPFQVISANQRRDTNQREFSRGKKVHILSKYIIRIPVYKAKIAQNCHYHPPRPVFISVVPLSAQLSLHKEVAGKKVPFTF